MKTNNLKLLVCCLFVKAIFLSCISVPPNDTKMANELVLNREKVVEEMFRNAHEAIPHGVLPNRGYRNKPTLNNIPGLPPGWTQILSWGQVYASNYAQCVPPNCRNHAYCNPDLNFPNVRVHLKDLQIFIYTNENKWISVDNAELDKSSGRNYKENYVDDINKPADIHSEPEGGISVQAGSGWNFHFWGNMKTANPNDIENYIQAIFVVMKARLVGVQNNENPKYILNVGADFWRNRNSKPVYTEDDTYFANRNNTGIGQGLFKYVTPEWQYFTFHNFKTRAAAQAAIINNPLFSEVLLKEGIMCK